MHDSTFSFESAKTNYALGLYTCPNYEFGFLATLASALIVSDLSDFTIYIGYPSDEPIDAIWVQVERLCQRFNFPLERCHRVPIQISQFAHYKPFKNGTHHTYGRYYLACKIQEPTLVYLDSDMLVIDDLSKLVKAFPQGKMLAAVQDRYVKTHENDLYKLNGAKENQDNAIYFNSGLLIFNTQAFQNVDVFSEFNNLHTQISESTYSDQSYLNVIFKRKWHPLPMRWNTLTYPKRPADLHFNGEQVAIFHFVTPSKPWLKAELDRPNLFWHCIAHAIGLQLDPTINAQFEEQIAGHLNIDRKHLFLRMLYYWIQPSKRHKAKNLYRILQLKSDVNKMKRFLERHQLPEIPELFGRILTV